MPGSASKSVFSAVLSRSQPKVRQSLGLRCADLYSTTKGTELFCPPFGVGALTVAQRYHVHKSRRSFLRIACSDAALCSLTHPPPPPRGGLSPFEVLS